jgi:predicted nucleic acid-binding protein
MSASAGVFVDTNVLVYLLSDDERKAAIAETLLTGRTLRRVISTQVVSEFVHTARRKARLDWPEIRAFVDVFHDACRVEPVCREDQDLAFEIAESLGFNWYDSMIVAAALNAEATLLFSEDLQDRQRIHGLTIVNPFVDSAEARF